MAKTHKEEVRFKQNNLFQKNRFFIYLIRPNKLPTLARKISAEGLKPEVYS
jgi:hypothetical protein